jgi:tetratricopeptide (TPR) repeat protein
MARASGKAADGLVTGEFFHRNSGVKYGIFNRDGRTWMAYQREGERGPRGQRELLYYIGSGRKGRSYLFSVEGFLFETPINWYSQEGRWNMAPAYTEATEIPMNLPSLVDCLNCHTTGMQAPIKGTDNRFAGKPFTQGGIGCARCHGPGQAHLDGKGPIVNPAKLPPERRDSVCMECHFEGTVAIEQRGKHLYEFRPGDDISDYIHYFLLSGTQSDTPKAVSQFEAFAQSMCKRKSGDKMSCLSCHDPHVEPSGEEKAAYYRGKCLACHGARGFAAKHHPEEKDCTKCHMPALPSKDVAHTQATDHRILRYANGPELQNQQLVPQLIAFPAGAAARTSDRDLALAWETLSQRKIDGSSARAEQYLRKSLKETPDDPVLLGAMAFIEQERGHDQQARDLYERTLKLDPEANEAAVNLGVLEARNGNLGRSIQLWKGAFDRVPYRSAVGLNLAMANCAAGRMDEARRYVQRVMDFNPDSKSARRLLEHLSGDPVSCKP